MIPRPVKKESGRATAVEYAPINGQVRTACQNAKRKTPEDQISKTCLAKCNRSEFTHDDRGVSQATVCVISEQGTATNL